MSILLHGDCLDEMKALDDNSIDLIFCDLPYGQTSCKWDCKIDLEKFWIEIMRIKKINTPLFFTTTTKFGVDLINSAPKKCPFRYDLVWVKSAPAGFLSAKKMPMRKHEMVYVFYEKLPFYDLSSHTHKFLKSSDNIIDGDTYNTKHRKKPITREPADKYDPPLPVSVVKEDIRKDKHKTAYGENIHYHNNQQKNGESIYDPPLPVSVVKEDKHTLYGEIEEKGIPHTTTYDPPLPTTMLEIKSTRGKHSTEKPVALMEWILKYYSKEGDVVLDPTMGSGSTGVACKNMKRNFIGIEMDPEIYEVAVNRLED
jgi:site-specific DNA-methyltransferase (adenine-specific)